ncbi:MAG: diguanylate cyclase (GGDEF)-like protein [Sulfurimonas sp.]|jgi:diguanylate cyclase (GGDEF)-like protein
MKEEDKNDTLRYIKDDFKKINILLVEDDPLLLNEYIRLLGRFFDNIDFKRDGLDGLNAALNKKYDLIISDVNMPFMNGLEMIEKIKEKYPNQNSLIVSAHDDSNILHKSVDIGVDGYIFKPLDVAQTIKTLSKVIRKILMEKENLLYKINLEELVVKKTNEVIETYTIDSVSKLYSLAKLHQDIAKSSNESLAILKIKNFKLWNDFYGYDVGNNILLQTAKCLKEIVTTNPLIAHAKLYRISGAHFAILIPLSGKYFEHQVNKIIDEFENTEIVINEQRVYLELNAGVVCYKDGISLSNADSALRMAEKGGKTVIYSINEDKIKTQAMKLQCNDSIKRALIDNRFVPFYHAIVDNKTNTIMKYEALARMIMPDGEVMSPEYFLPVSKQTKTYNKITKAILQKALKDFSDSDCSISLNISIDDIEHKQTRDYILSQISMFPEPQRIVFELLESENVISYNEVKSFFRELKALGCKVAIDDFGSGYSNFEHIAKLNVDYIKIDGSLIDAMENEIASLTIVEMLSAFASKMNIRTIAEYVSSSSIHSLVHSIGIDESQGFVFGEPIAFNDTMMSFQSINKKA